MLAVNSITHMGQERLTDRSPITAEEASDNLIFYLVDKDKTDEHPDGDSFQVSRSELIEILGIENNSTGQRLKKVINIVDNTAVPPTEVNGDRYILDNTGSSHANWDGASAWDVVEFNGTNWIATTPSEGNVTYVDAENKDAIYVDDGTGAWELRSTSFSSPVSRTGNTIMFDVPAEYNATTPASSGNITLDDTDAVAGIVQSFYFNGATEPTISGITIQARSGLFSANRLNIYRFEYNTKGDVILNIQTDNTPQLIAPQNLATAVNSSTELGITWDASVNATNYVLERDTNSDFSTATEIHSGALLTYTDSGLTEGTTYYYRVKAEATGFVDSVWSEASGTPTATTNFTLVGLVESPTGTFEAQAAGNYGSNYGVDAVNVQSGAFTFIISLDNTSVNPEGCMFGVSTSSVNNAWNVGNWNAGAYVVNGSLQIFKITNGVAANTGSTAVLTSGNTLKLTRDGSNNVKLLYNDVEINDFGVIAGDLYYHISAYTNKYVIVQ